MRLVCHSEIEKKVVKLFNHELNTKKVKITSQVNNIFKQILTVFWCVNIIDHSNKNLHFKVFRTTAASLKGLLQIYSIMKTLHKRMKPL